MHAVDVNVLLAAVSTSHPHHVSARVTLEQLLAGAEPVGFPDVVLSGFLRLATSRAVFPQPLNPDEAWAAIDAVTGSPAARAFTPGPRHWGIFRGLCERYHLRGGDVTDAYLAAQAIEQHATWVSFDLGFARFRELTWLNPADSDR
jgi:hypothetical protein